MVIKIKYATEASKVIKVTYDTTPVYISTSVSSVYIKIYSGLNTNGGTVTSIATSAPITGGTITTSGTIGITQATTSSNGYLNSTDWNTFNNKQGAITLTTTGTSGASTFIGNTLNIPQYEAEGNYVTTATTLTINGTTYDLSANRSWSVGTVTSVGLTMPVAFAVGSSPITGAGTLAVTAIGTAAQYIRGDGQLATLPSGSSGGSSVNYYLNGSVTASVAGYKQMSNSAIIGGGTDFPLVGNGLIAQFLTDVANPNRLLIPGGAWNFEMYFNMSSNGGNPKFYVELLKYNGATFTSIASSSAIPESITGGTTIDLYLTSLAVPETVLLTSDRLAIRVYIVDNSGGRTARLHTEDNHLCEIITTFAGGIAALNGLTANTQYFAVGTSGTDFNISSSVATHTFNIPDASASNRGLVTTGTQTIAGSKTFSGQIISTLTGSTTTGGGQLYLNGATSNRIDFNQNGIGAPTFTTRSVGSKIVFYSGISESDVDFAMGIESGAIWYSAGNTSSTGFKWYGGTTVAATLSGAGAAIFTSNVKTNTFFGFNALTTDSDIFGMWTTTSAAGGTTVATAGNTTLRLRTNNTTRLSIDGAGASTFSSTVTSTQFRLSALNTVPVSSTATGTTGEIRIDANYIYICTATNTWKRVAIATW